MATEEDQKDVMLGFDKETMADILMRAGSQDRTVVEFVTVENDDQRVVDHVKEITEHVAELEGSNNDEE